MTHVDGSAGVQVVRSSQLSGVVGTVHGFSTRHGGTSRVYRPGLPEGDGDLNLGYTAQDDAACVRKNRLRFLHALPGQGLRGFMLLKQTHTPNVRIVESVADAAEDFTAPATREGDGLMTDVPGVLLAVGAADCIPVLVADPVRRVVAAFHAGWRGTAARIVEHGIAAMTHRYGSSPSDLLAVVGPGIGPQSYVVSEELRTHFAAEFTYAADLFHEVSCAGEDAALHLDLWEANRRQLTDAGVAPGRIEVLALDTARDTDTFFSHRAEHGFTGRMLGVIGLKS